MKQSYTVGDKDQRPWGTWEVLSVGLGFVIKIITVDPNKRLSLQYHLHRNEVWTILSGIGEVAIGDTTTEVAPGKCFHIPALVCHRIENTGAKPLRFIEIQTGSILDEADIVREVDDYGRA